MFDHSGEPHKFKQLSEATQNLFRVIEAKGIKTLVNYAPSNYDLKFALQHMGYDIKGSPLSKKRGMDATFQRSKDMHSVTDFRLVYQQAQIGARLFSETLLANALEALKQKTDSTLLAQDEVKVVYMDLLQIFKSEFILNERASEFSEVVRAETSATGAYFQEERPAESIQVGELSSSTTSAGVISLAFSDSSKEWQHQYYFQILRRFVDTYFIVGLTLLTLIDILSSGKPGTIQNSSIDKIALTKGLMKYIQKAYVDGLVVQLNSCLSPSVSTSISRLTQLCSY